MAEMIEESHGAQAVRDSFGDVLDSAERGRAGDPHWVATVVTRRERPSAVVVNYEWYLAHRNVEIPGGR